MISTGTLLLGKYRIAERLGEGGMGTVYRARDELLDRDVAVKLLRADLAGNAALAERFRGEAIALARLTHPAIAALHGLERDGDQLYMIMEFVPGETLEARIQRDGPLAWRQAAEVCAAVCDAMEHAHRQGVVHRDIKPANLMLVPGGGIKVMDFGIARMAGQSRQTRMGSTVGTPHYMAPEQLRGEEVDGRADLYSLGAVLFELISGKVPFDADSDYQLMMKQLHDQPPHLSSEVASVPRAIDRVVQRAMSKDRATRFSSATEMRAALSNAVTAPDAALLHGEAVPIHRDWRTWTAGAMVVIALAVMLAGGDEPTAATGPTPVVEVPPASVTSPLPLDEASPRAERSGPSVVGVSSVPVSPVPSPRPEPPPTRVRERQQPPPPPPPPPSSRQVGSESRSEQVNPPPPPAAAQVEPSAAVGAAVREWIAALRRRDPGGLTGAVGGDPLAPMIRNGTASVDDLSAPRIAIDGDGATATLTASVGVRSSFGASRKTSATFRLALQSGSGGTWRVTGARVE